MSTEAWSGLTIIQYIHTLLQHNVRLEEDNKLGFETALRLVVCKEFSTIQCSVDRIIVFILYTRSGIGRFIDLWMLLSNETVIYYHSLQRATLYSR